MSTYNPMLAANVKPENVPVGALMSVKLEGVRGQCYTTGLLTRQLKPFPTRQLYERMEQVEQFCSYYGISLEGELYVHGWTFDRIQSATRAEDNPDALELEFHVFDCFVENIPDATFEERYRFYKWAIACMHGVSGMHFVKAVEQIPVTNSEQVLTTYEQALTDGYEGLVFKDAKGKYKNGRSTVKQGLFTRAKPDDPFDAVILEIVERQNNLLESEVNELGYQFKRQDKDAKAGAGIAQTAVVYCPALNQICRVSLTKGLQDYQATDKGPSRQTFWVDRERYVGAVMKFTGIPVKGQKPRSPRYDSLRYDLEPIYLAHHESDALLITFDEAQALAHQEQGVDRVSKECFFEWLEKGYTLGN